MVPALCHYRKLAVAEFGILEGNPPGSDPFPSMQHFIHQPHLSLPMQGLLSSRSSIACKEKPVVWCQSWPCLLEIVCVSEIITAPYWHNQSAKPLFLHC